MISEETKEKVASIFGWKFLQATKYGSSNPEDDISLVWIAEFKIYRRYVRHETGVIVGVVKSELWRKGVLLLPTPEYDQKTYIGLNTLTPVELLADPVEEVLKNFDLTTPYRRPGIHEQSHAFDFCIMGKAMNAQLEIDLAGWGENQGVDNLQRAIGAVINDLRKQYSREDMNRFFE